MYGVKASLKLRPERAEVDFPTSNIIQTFQSASKNTMLIGASHVTQSDISPTQGMSNPARKIVVCLAAFVIIFFF